MEAQKSLIFLEVLAAGIIRVAELGKDWVLLGRDTEKEVDFRPCLHNHRYRDGFSHMGDISVTFV
jgi:hypothetical protein